MSVAQNFGSVTGQWKSEVVLPLVIASLASATVALALTSPLLLVFLLGIIIFVASIFQCDLLLYLIVFFLPLAPLANIAHFPVHDLVSLVRVLVFSGIFIRKLLKGESVRAWLCRRPIEKLAIFYFLVAVASATVANPVSASAVRSLLRLASYLAFYYSLTDWIRTANQLRKVVVVLLASTITICIVGVSQAAQGAFGGWYYWLHSSVEEYLELWQGRISSVFTHVNQFAAYLNLVLPLALAVESDRLTGVALRRVAGACFVLGTIALVLTQSRGGLLAYVCLVWIVLYAFKKEHPVRFKLLSVGLMAVVIACVIYVSSEQVADVVTRDAGRQAHVESWQRFVELDEMTVGRLYIYASSWDMFLSKPGWGIGYGNFRLRLSGLMTGVPEGALDTHNLYLSLLAETGVAGFLCFMGLIIFIMHHGRKGLQDNAARIERVFGSALLAAMGAVLVHGFVDVMTDLPQFGALLWMLVAMSVVAGRVQGALRGTLSA